MMSILLSLIRCCVGITQSMERLRMLYCLFVLMTRWHLRSAAKTILRLDRRGMLDVRGVSAGVRGARHANANAVEMPITSKEKCELREKEGEESIGGIVAAVATKLLLRLQWLL